MVFRNSALEVLEQLRLLLQAFHRAKAVRHARKLLQRLGGLVDARMRALVVRDAFSSLSIGTLAELVHFVYTRAGEKRGASEMVLVSLVASDEVRKGLPRPLVNALAREMQARGYNEALRLVASAAGGRAFDRDLEGVPRPTEPLGWRIAMARRPAIRNIERLLYDPDPRVIWTVLGNPRLTEGDVLKIVSSKHSSPEVLDAIARDPRWIARYAVKLALIYNGHTPPGIALVLLPSLLQQDLRDVAGAAVPADVRARAQRLLDQRDAHRATRLTAET